MSDEIRNGDDEVFDDANGAEDETPMEPAASDDVESAAGGGPRKSAPRVSSCA